MTQDDIIRMAREAGMSVPTDIWQGLGTITRADLERFADQILEEVAQEIAKLPFNDTASSFAVFVRQMKVNRSDNESGRSPLSAKPTSAE